MSYRTDEKELKYRFGKFGDIENVVLVWNNQLNRSRGFGFITFRDIESATEAVEKMNGKEIDGQDVRVDFSFTKQGRNERDRDDRRGGYVGGRRRSRSRSHDRRRRSRSRSNDRRRRRSRSDSYDRRDRR